MEIYLPVAELSVNWAIILAMGVARLLIGLVTVPQDIYSVVAGTP